MLSIAVCDDEVIECCNMAKRIETVMDEMKISCIICQFRSGGELSDSGKREKNRDCEKKIRWVLSGGAQGYAGKWRDSMKQLLNDIDIFIAAPFFLGYL